jgi:hypothetical protein
VEVEAKSGNDRIQLANCGQQLVIGRLNVVSKEFFHRGVSRPWGEMPENQITVDLLDPYPAELMTLGIPQGYQLLRL